MIKRISDFYDPEDPEAGLVDAIEQELSTWDQETLINYARQELNIEFPEAFEEIDDLISEIAVEIIKDPDQKEVWVEDLRTRLMRPEELYG